MRRTSSISKSTWLLAGLTVIETGSFVSPMRRLTSKRALAGIITVTSSEIGSASVTLSTESRNPSAAAKVRVSPWNSALTPVSTGLESSVAAAKTTRPRALRKASASTLAAMPSPISGIGGNSSASMPLRRASNRAHLISRFLFSGNRLRETFSFGSELMKSERIRAGTVMAPSSSTFAPIQWTIATSRLVVASFSRPWSVDNNTLLVMGSVVRTATARLTTPKPLLIFSCKQVTFMGTPN